MTTVDQLPTYLLRYFNQRGSVTVPGLGKLVNHRTASFIDVANRRISPPSEHLHFQEGDQQISDHELHYLTRIMGVNEDDLRKNLTLISEQILEKLSSEKKLEWMGIGSFVIDEDGKIGFNPKQQHLEIFRSIPYTHVIRENTQHEILVGDEQRYTHEMEEYFEEQRHEKKEKRWRTAALVLISIGLALLLARYMLGSYSVFEGRYSAFSAKEPRATHQAL